MSCTVFSASNDMVFVVEQGTILARVVSAGCGDPCSDTKWPKTLSGIIGPLSVIMPLSATTRH